MTKKTHTQLHLEEKAEASNPMQKPKQTELMRKSRARNHSGALNPSYRHGHSLRGKLSSEYMTWGDMMNRCKNATHKAYANYGGRGITVCERWKNFSNFIADMGARPHFGMLDRKDNSLGYSPENCRWATRTEQNNNRRNNIILTHEGKTMTLSQWSALSPVSYRAFHKRITIYKMSIAEALTRKPGRTYRKCVS